MPSILSAGNATNSGVNLTGAVDGTLQIKTGSGAGTTAITIDASQNVTFAVPPAGIGFPSGTVMLFVQTAAPTGWTKSTANNDKALRVVSGNAGTGGSVAFTTAFASGLNAGNTTLSTSQMPSHTHPGASAVNGSMGGGDQTLIVADGGTGATGGGGSHNHTIPSFAVSYVDVIIATAN
jgi:hypothetical protein